MEAPKMRWAMADPVPNANPSFTICPSPGAAAGGGSFATATFDIGFTKGFCAGSEGLDFPD